MNILGIRCSEPMSACLICGDGRIFAETASNSFTTAKTLGVPADAIFRILAGAGISTDSLSAVAVCGEDTAGKARIVNSLLVHPLNRQGWKDVLQLSEPDCTAHYHAQLFVDDKAILVSFSSCGFLAWRLIEGYAEPIDLELDTTGKLPALLKDIASTLLPDVEEPFEKLISCQAQQDDDYYEFLKSALPFNPNGRVDIAIPYDEIIQHTVENFRTKTNDVINIDVRNKSAASSFRRWLKEMSLHLLQYVSYVSGESKLVLDGDIAACAISRQDVLSCVPFTEVIPSHLPAGLSSAAGAALIAASAIRPAEAADDDKKRIFELLEERFEHFRQGSLDAIRECFNDQTHPIVITLEDAFNRCKDIRYSFDIKGIHFNSSRRLAWAVFDHLVFASFKDTGWPFIVKHKCIAYLRRERDDWQLDRIEFTIFDADPILTIEVTDHCNYKCRMCDQSRRELVHGSPKGLMSYDVWKGLIDGIGDTRMGTITPFWLGESLVNPEFARMLRYAFENNSQNSTFINFTLNTNGSLLNRNIADSMLDCAAMEGQADSTFIRLHFSIDACTPEVFENVHGVNLFEQTIANIRYFLKARNERNLQFPKVTLAFIVMPENHEQAGQFLEFWSQELASLNREFDVVWDWPAMPRDAIYLRRLDYTDQLQAERLHKETIRGLGLLPPEKAVRDDERILHTDSVLLEPSQRDVKTFVRRPCPGLWRTPIVNWNGDVTVCCFDIDLKLKIGNLHNSTFEELWWGPRIENWRMTHIKGQFDKIPACANCANLNAPVMSDADFVRYLIETNRPDEIQPFLDRVGSGL